MVRTFRRELGTASHHLDRDRSRTVYGTCDHADSIRGDRDMVQSMDGVGTAGVKCWSQALGLPLGWSRWEAVLLKLRDLDYDYPAAMRSEFMMSISMQVSSLIDPLIL